MSSSTSVRCASVRSTSVRCASVRCAYRLFNEKGEKLATAVTYQDTIFQVAPEKKSFPNFESWKAEYPSYTTFTEQQDAVKESVCRPYRKATTLSLRHLMEYKFQFPGKELYVMNDDSKSLIKIHYKTWFENAFTIKRNPDNSLETIQFTSFTELGFTSETPDIWVGDDCLGIREVKLPMYDPAPGQKEAFILVNGRNTSVLAALELKKKLDEAGILVHYGFYDKDTRFKEQIWIGSPNVFKVSQMHVKNADNTWGYAPVITHMREKPWKKDIDVESIQKAVTMVK